MLKVENVNVSMIPRIAGAVHFDYYAGCNVINNGRTTVTQWSVLFAAIHA